jgi:hypothetical protein
MQLQNIPPEILDQLQLELVKIYSIPYKLSAPKRAEPTSFDMQALQKKFYCVSVGVTAFETLHIPDPAQLPPPAPVLPEIADTNKAVTYDRLDRDELLVRIKRVDGEIQTPVAEGSELVQGVDIFMMEKLVNSGLFPGFIIPRFGQLKFDVIHNYEGQRPQLQFPVFGKIILLGFHFK